MIEKKIIPIRYKFKYPFHIAHGIRTHTSAIILQLSLNNHIAYGECPLPPYLEENQQSVSSFLNTIDLPRFILSNIEGFIADLIQEQPLQSFAIACLDIALTNLKAQLDQVSTYDYFQTRPTVQLPNSITLGFSDFNELKLKIASNSDKEMFKLKLGSQNDAELIQNFRLLSDKPFIVDANQGWDDIGYAKEMSEFLYDKGALLIEQPFSKNDHENQYELRKNCPLPIIADESLQNVNDLPKIVDLFDGINIKLMKCGGIHPALQLLTKAKELNLSILLGCMSGGLYEYSSSLVLADQCDWIDLDGLSLNNLCELD